MVLGKDNYFKDKLQLIAGAKIKIINAQNSILNNLIENNDVDYFNINTFIRQASLYKHRLVFIITNTTTMAVATGNVPLPPHMNFNFRRIRIGLIGDNAPSKRICFSPAMSRSKALKTLRWFGDDGDESRLAIGAF